MVIECIGNTAYHFDFSVHQALRGMHNVFHVSLLCDWYSNRLHDDVPPVQIDGKDEYKVVGIKGH